VARRLVIALAVLALACDDNRPPRPDRPEKPGEALVLDATAPTSSAAPNGSSGAEAFVEQLRNQKLDISARRSPTQRIAFGKNTLAQLTDAGLVIRDTKGFKETTKVSVPGPRRLASLSDGSLLVLGESSVQRLPRDPKKNQTFSRIPLFVDSVVFPDRRKERQLWVFHGIDTTLYPYALTEDDKLDTLDFLELAEFDQRGITLLKDGSFVYTAKNKLKRFYPGGKVWTLDLTSGADVWRILTTRRLDELWLARSDGQLELLRISENSLQVVRRLDAKGAFDIASNDAELAILKLESAAGPDGGTTTRVWKLSVLDADGKEKMSQTLPFNPAPGSGESWVREVTKNRAVVLSSYGPYVAVGGPDEVTVFDYRSGAKVFGG
jgi:hypothetical protein